MTAVGAIETGGTHTRFAIGAPDGTITELAVVTTGAPDATVAAAAEFFARRKIAKLGIAAFGPIDVDASSRTYGTLRKTPKPGWSGFPLKEALERALGVAARVETDVNAAALAEQRKAVAEGLAAGTLAYVTVGTGIGAGVAFDGRAHHGALHPEAGHLFVARAPGADRDPFEGSCPFHGDCLEGLASGTAIHARARPIDARFEAHYLAQFVLAIVGFLAPHQIVLGGGVMKTPALIEQVRARALELSKGYSPLLSDPRAMLSYIVLPRLGDHSGLIGALQLAG